MIANRVALRHNGMRARIFRKQMAQQDPMSPETDSAIGEQAFLRVAATCGIDTSDADRMADLRARVALMRQGLARVYEIDVSGAESPSVFVPNRP